MRNFNGSFLYESSGPGRDKGPRMKNRCSSPECKCSPPVVNVHHYQCPLMKTPCPLHGYPFIYNLKSKKTPPDQCLVISFHPSLKTDKLFEPVKTFLSETCEPDTKISFQYYSPRLSKVYREDFKHRQVQTNPEDFKKLANSCFVEKTKTFFSDKTNKMKKLKQCFNSPCSSIVHKSRSCTAIKEKTDRIVREETGDKSKLEKRIKGACCMKPEQSSHFLYKRDFDLSNGEKSSKEKIDSDFITKINNNLFDSDVFEIGSRKGFNGRMSGNMKPHFMYPSFVSPDPIKEKVQGHTQTEEVSDLERTCEGSQNPDVHEVKEGHDKGSPDGSHSENTSSDSSSSAYFTPFVFVPGGNERKVKDKGIQTVKIEPKMSYQWVQTIEYFHESVSKRNQTKNSEIFVAKTNFMKSTETQTSAVFMPEACICGRPQITSEEKGKEKPVKTNVGVQTPHQKRSSLLPGDLELIESVETATKDSGVKEKSVEVVEPVSVGTQTQGKPVTPTTIYYEPEMKFLRREGSSENEKKGVEAEENKSVGVQTEGTIGNKERSPESEDEPRSKKVEIQETRNLSTLFHNKSAMSFLRTEKTPEIADKRDEVEEPKSVGLQTQKSSTIVYYEPEMEFLRRDKSSESVRDVKEQTQSNSEPVTVIYFEPEAKALRRKDESGKRGVFFSEETHIKEIETDKKDESVGTEPETFEESGREREKYDSAYLTMSQHKENQANSDSDNSQSYYNGSDSSNVTYVVKSYVSEESDQVVVKNWNRSRSDGDMLDKKKCDCLTKADQVSPPTCQYSGTNPNGLTFVGVYRSKKESYGTSNPQDSKKAQQSKPEAIAKKNEDNNASFADLSDLIRIIDENFKKMFDRTIGMCECQQKRERKPTADKEVMTDISGGSDIDVILKMATRSMANAQIQACLPIVEEMPLARSSSPNQEPPTSICEVCSKVISMTTVSVGTNTPDGSYIQTKMEEVGMGTYCEEFPIESIREASCSKPISTENPSTSKGKSGGIKSVRMSAKTFVTRLESPTESNGNHTPSPTFRKTITYSEPFSDSTTSLQRDLRRAQQECGVKPKPSRPTPSPKSRPTPKPRQTQLSQSRPQVVTRLIPDEYCGNIVATITTRRTPSVQTEERCPFKPPSTNCDDVDSACPLPPRTNPEQCFQGTQPSKEPDSKQKHMTYHVTLSPIWSKDIMNMFQRKLKKISKSESSDSVTDSSGKQKRNHDGGSDGGPIGKRIKSIECEETNIFETGPLEREGIDCFEFGKSQTNILFKFLMKGENELVLEEISSRLTKDSGFVWIPSLPSSQFFSIRQVSSAEETSRSKETIKEVSRRHSHVLSKIPEESNYNNLSTKDTCHQNPDYIDENTVTRKLFRCSSCKSLTYIQLKNSDIIERPQNNSTNFKSNLEDSFRNSEFTPQSHSLVETPSWDPIPESSSLADDQSSLLNSKQKHVETVPSTENNILSSGTDQTHRFFDECYFKYLSKESDSNFEIDSNRVETCDNSQLPTSNSAKVVNISRSNKFSFHESSANVSNSKMATKSECLRTFQFCAESSTVIPNSKKTILKNLHSKIFQSSKKKSKGEITDRSNKKDRVNELVRPTSRDEGL